MRPYVVISEEGEKFLCKGQMWMYKNNGSVTTNG